MGSKVIWRASASGCRHGVSLGISSEVLVMGGKGNGKGEMGRNVRPVRPEHTAR